MFELNDNRNKTFEMQYVAKVTFRRKLVTLIFIF